MAKRELDPQVIYTLKKIGARIKQLRLAQGHSNYEQFAYEHELPRSQMGRYEQGFDLQVSSLLKVLTALDINIVDFFNEDFTNLEVPSKKKSS